MNPKSRILKTVLRGVRRVAEGEEPTRRQGALMLRNLSCAAYACGLLGVDQEKVFTWILWS